jgi:hypothetical protein
VHERLVEVEHERDGLGVPRHAPGREARHHGL